MDQYNVYTTQDFLTDLDFVKSVKYPDHAEARRWAAWRAAQPPNAAAYDEALFYLSGILGLERLVPTQLYADQLYMDIEEGIEKNKRNKKRKVRRLLVYRITAAAVLLCAGLFWYFTSLITVATGNGEIQMVQLPDSSVVQLNANSSIVYRRALMWLDKREVHVTGEALFDVKHLAMHTSLPSSAKTFIAYSGNIAVEVLGTKFNIKNRGQKTIVSLLEGKIALRNVSHPGEVKILEAGDVATYAEHSVPEIEKNAAAVAQASAWVEKNLVATNLSVGELIDEFRYIYGREIVITDTTLLKTRIDGRISLHTAENVIYSLANILQANIRIDQDTVYLDPKKGIAK
ncbi:FecR family protein [Sphingobacterium haloxyli]|uniref:FecR protein domain-containing protein n=1 Tax=Sphingobacterium haloxyli TaxID=2100533 RepID=A0A2S9J2D2_9SPHI|nr:FecR domain-containing protein [Sphingobacterium haloxyli]PRD46947.1 hypothetical protein C5745_12675 [Sphingobacterium haloxyli]